MGLRQAGNDRPRGPETREARQRPDVGDNLAKIEMARCGQCERRKSPKVIPFGNTSVSRRAKARPIAYSSGTDSTEERDGAMEDRPGKE